MTHRVNPWQTEPPPRTKGSRGPAPGAKYRPRTRPTLKSIITKPIEATRAERRDQVAEALKELKRILKKYDKTFLPQGKNST